jgi:hypothetical protein
MKRLQKYLPDLLLVAGVATLATGLWWIYPPAALIALGVIAAGIGFLLGRKV